MWYTESIGYINTLDLKNMSSSPWFFTAILTVLIIIGIAFMAMRKNKRPIDYYSLFVIGLIWVLIGIPMAFSSQTYALPSLGLLFMITGLVNRKKWAKNRRTWSQLSSSEKKVKMIMIIILAALVLMGIAFYYLTKN